MKVVKGDFKGKRARVVKGFVGGHVISLGLRAKYHLGKDIHAVYRTADNKELGAGRVLLIILLGATIIGLIIAIPMLLLARKRQVTYQITTNDGKEFLAVADRAEGKILDQYVSAPFPA